MNSAEYVDKLIKDQIAQGIPRQQVAWNAALACVGWAYVFGARGQYCTPANRRARYSDAHPTIKSKCQNFNGSGSAGCSGCRWYPGGKYTRFFDCRGFTYWVLKSVYDGWELMGAGATSQWNTESNWKAKGTVADGVPADTLVCLFVKKGSTMEHTGFGLNNETCECSNGVQHFTKRDKKWTHWGVPVVIDGTVPTPTPTPTPTTKPTLRKGDSGEWVTLMQTLLIQKGYPCGDTGADGKFGNNTERALKRFQQDNTDSDGNPLKVDGVCGQKSWDALESQTIMYTVTIPHLPKYHADALVVNYPGAYMTEEGG